MRGGGKEREWVGVTVAPRANITRPQNRLPTNTGAGFVNGAGTGRFFEPWEENPYSLHLIEISMAMRDEEQKSSL